jgi:hypothetical protein
MKLNFRKLKNSLLSLGLSATLFCTAGFHASADDPTTPEQFEEASRALDKVLRYGPSHTAVTGDKPSRTWLSSFLPLCARARENGLQVPVEMTEDGFWINTADVGAAAGIPMNTLYARFNRAGAKDSRQKAMKRDSVTMHFYKFAPTPEPAALVDFAPRPPLPAVDFGGVAPRGSAAVEQYTELKRAYRTPARQGDTDAIAHSYIDAIVSASETALTEGRTELVTALWVGTNIIINFPKTKTLTGTCKSHIRKHLKRLGLHKAGTPAQEVLSDIFGPRVDPATSRLYQLWAPSDEAPHLPNPGHQWTPPTYDRPEWPDWPAEATDDPALQFPRLAENPPADPPTGQTVR